MPSRNDESESTITVREREQSRAGLANVLALPALLALGFAYLMMFAVLGDTNYASKFENGELPAGFNGSGGQAAAVASIGAAIFAVVLTVAALATRVTKTTGTVAILGLVALVPYVPLELVTWELAY